MYSDPYPIITSTPTLMQPTTIGIIIVIIPYLVLLLIHSAQSVLSLYASNRYSAVVDVPFFSTMVLQKQW